MPPFGPTKRHELIQYLGKAGFVGPRFGTKHEIMRRGEITVRLPNPHRGDNGKGLLARILKEAGISKDGWEKL